MFSRLSTIAMMFFCLGVSADNYDAWQSSATYDIDYVVDLSVLPKDEAVNIWVPLPVSDHNQELISFEQFPKVLDGTQKTIVDNRGNKIIEFNLPANEARAEKLHLHYVIRREPSTGQAKDLLTKKDEPRNFLASTNKIPLDGLMMQIAEEQKQAASSNSELQRRYYDYVYDSMTYSKEGEGWGEGDAIWACQSNYGNCTDFHSLYIGLVRSQGIPARFKIGFPLSATEAKGRHDGYHCWAETYDDAAGWVPLDASEAKKSGLKNHYYGHLPSDRIEFTQGRDIILSEKQRGEPINYFIYPYAETRTDIVPRLPVQLSYERHPSPVIKDWAD